MNDTFLSRIGPGHWGDSADVVVLGRGYAAAITPLEAADAGFGVLVNL